MRTLDSEGDSEAYYDSNFYNYMAELGPPSFDNNNE